MFFIRVYDAVIKVKIAPCLFPDEFNELLLVGLEYRLNHLGRVEDCLRFGGRCGFKRFAQRSRVKRLLVGRVHFGLFDDSREDVCEMFLLFRGPRFGAMRAMFLMACVCAVDAFQLFSFFHTG